jgi:hypothetical protein
MICDALLAGQAAVVRVLFRRLRGRCPDLCPAPVHRAAEPPVLTGFTPGRLHHWLEGRRTGGHFGSRRTEGGSHVLAAT